MTPGPISSTRITPTPTLEWDVTSSNQFDDVGSYTLTINLSVAATTPFPLRIGKSGSGIYNLDWKIDGLDENSEVTVSSGVLTHAVRVLVVENLDVTEQHILTIENNGYYNVGIDSVHIATCTNTRLKPTDSNVGHQSSTSLDVDSSWTYNAPVHKSGKHFTDVVVLNSGASGSTFIGCHFRGGGLNALKMQGASNCIFTNCTFGQDPVGTWNDLNDHSLVYFYSGANSSNSFTACRWMQSGGDCVKLSSASSTYFESCFFSYGGFKPNKHADAIQVETGVSVSGISCVGCRFDWAPGDAEALGAESNGAFQVNKFATADDAKFISCWFDGWGNYYFNWNQLSSGGTGGMVVNCQIGGTYNTDYRHHLIEVGSHPVQRSGNKDLSNGGPLFDRFGNPFNTN